MPFREMTYDEFDEATRIKMEKLLKEWGAFGYILHPKNAELKLHTASNAGDCPYPDLIAACDASISKCILGNTLTTEQGSTGTQALGSVHMQVEESKHLSDMRFVLSILNTQFKAILKRFGFNVQGGDIWFETPKKDWAKMQIKWNVISGIASRVPVSDDYIYEEFDIPKPDNYEELKQEMKERQNIALSIPADTLQQNALPSTDFFV
jgi:phage gp29-like protein